VSQFKECCLC